MTRQPVRSTEPVGHFTNGVPIVRPVRFGEFLEGAHHADGDFRFVELRIEHFKIRKGKYPGLDAAVQRIVIDDTPLGVEKRSSRARSARHIARR
jgi:hypothetical protein